MISFVGFLKNLSGKNGQDRLAAGCILTLWLYLFLPFRLLAIPVSFGQVEEWALSAVWLILTGLFLLVARFGHRQFTGRLSVCDILMSLYGVYLALRTLEYPTARQSLPALFTLSLLYVIVRVLNNRYNLFIISLLAVALIVQVVTDYFFPYGSISGKASVLSGIAHPVGIAITGLFQNTGIFGGYAGIVSVGLYGVRLFWGRYNQLLTGLMLFSLILLVYSQSRAAWIGATGGIGLLSLIFLQQKYGAKIRKPAIAAFGLSVPLAVLAGKWLYLLKPVSATGRMYIWKISAQMLADNPLFGIGTDRFPSQYMYRQAAYFADCPNAPFAQIADETNVPFCEPLKIAIEQGVAGLAFVSAILIALLIPVFSNGKTREEACISYVFTAMLITLLVFSCFSYPFTYIQFHFLLIACMAVLSRYHTACRFTLRCNRSVLRFFIACMLVAGCIALTGIRYAVYMQRLNHTVTGFNIRQTEEILPALEAMETVLQANPVFLIVWSDWLFDNRAYEKAIEKKHEALAYQVSYTTCLELGRCYDRLGETERALAYWELCARMIPSRFEPLYLQIESCHRNGMYSRADSLTTLILQKKRKVDTLRIDLMIKDVREWQKQRQ